MSRFKKRRQKRNRVRSKSRRVQKKAEKFKKRRFGVENQIITIETSLIEPNQKNEKCDKTQKNSVGKVSQNKIKVDEKENFQLDSEFHSVKKSLNTKKSKKQFRSAKNNQKKVEKASPNLGKKLSKKKKSKPQTDSNSNTKLEIETLEPEKPQLRKKTRKTEPKERTSKEIELESQIQIETIRDCEIESENKKPKSSITPNQKKISEEKTDLIEKPKDTKISKSKDETSPKFSKKSCKKAESDFENLGVREDTIEKKKKGEETLLSKRRGKYLKLGRRIRKRRRELGKIQICKKSVTKEEAKKKKSKPKLKETQPTKKKSKSKKDSRQPKKENKANKAKESLQTENLTENGERPTINKEKPAPCNSSKPQTGKTPSTKPSVKSKKPNSRDMIVKKQSILRHARKYRTLDLFFSAAGKQKDTEGGLESQKVEGALGCERDLEIEGRVSKESKKKVEKKETSLDSGFLGGDCDVSVLLIEESKISEEKSLESSDSTPNPQISKEHLKNPNKPATQNENPDSPIIILEPHTPNQTDSKLNLQNDSGEKIRVCSSQEFNMRCILMKRNDEEANFTSFQSNKPKNLGLEIRTKKGVDLELPKKGKKELVIVKKSEGKKKKKSGKNLAKRVKREKKRKGGSKENEILIEEVMDKVELKNNEQKKVDKSRKITTNAKKNKQKTAKKNKKSTSENNLKKRPKKAKKNLKTKRQKKQSKKIDDDEEKLNSEGWSRKFLIDLLQKIVKLSKENSSEGISSEEIETEFRKTGFGGKAFVIERMIKHLAEKDKIFMSEDGRVYVI